MLLGGVGPQNKNPRHTYQTYYSYLMPPANQPQAQIRLVSGGICGMYIEAEKGFGVLEAQKGLGLLVRTATIVHSIGSTFKERISTHLSNSQTAASRRSQLGEPETWRMSQSPLLPQALDQQTHQMAFPRRITVYNAPTCPHRRRYPRPP